MRPELAAAALALALALGGCTDETLRREGESCSFSADCDNGLFCDLQASPPVCVRAGQPRDLTVVPVDASIDLSVVD